MTQNESKYYNTACLMDEALIQLINEKYLYSYLNYLKEHQKIYSISFKNPQILGSDENIRP